MTDTTVAKSIAWRPVLLLSGLGGTLYAGLTIWGWINGRERPVALLLCAICAALIVYRDLERPVLHGFLVGFLAGFVAIELQAVFLSTYFTYNPEYASVVIPLGLTARTATALFAPLVAIPAGLLTAGMAWLLGVVRRKGPPATSAAP